MPSPADSPASSRRVFHALDGLRWVAAVAVMTRHMPDQTLLHLLPGSYLAVDLFFCLSGFVLAHAYEERLQSGAMGWGDFLRARVIRLWPLYLLASFIGAALGMFLGIVRHGGADLWQAWGWSFLLSPFMWPAPGWASFVGFSPFPFASPSWSLFWEMVAGMAYALIAPVLTGRRLIAVLVISAVGLVWVSIGQGTIDVGSMWPTFPMGAIRVAWPFFGGIALHRLWRRGWLVRLRLPLPLSALALIAIFAIDPGRLRWGYDLLATLILFPLLVFVSTGEVASHAKAALARLGSVSYAVYLLHVPLLEWIQRVSELLGQPLEAQGVGGSLAVMSAAIVAAFAAEALFDKPISARLACLRASRRLEQPRRLRPRLGGHLGA